MTKIIIAAVAVLSIVPAAASAATNPFALTLPVAVKATTNNPYAPPRHFVSPLRLDCNAGGVITDMGVTPKTGAKVANDTVRWTMRRYAMTCGKPASVRIVITNQ